MKKRLISVFAFALVVSAGAAFVLYQLITTRVKAGTTAAPATTKIFVAARDLDTGTLIQERDLRVQEYLTPPAGAIGRKEDIVGRGVTNPIHEDAPFFERTLAAKGAGAGFAATIPKGMRAFAVHVDEVVGVAGFAVPGMRVDLLVSGVPPGEGEAGGSVTRTLLQNIEVLSAGQNYQKNAEGKPVLVQVVNLLVTPEQAEMVNLATDRRIQLVLRNPADRDIVETPGAAITDLFYGVTGRPRKPLAPARHAAITRPAEAPAASGPVQQAVSPVVPVAPETRTLPALQNFTIEVFAGDKKTEALVRAPLVREGKDLQ